MAYDIANDLATESGRIGPDIYRDTINTSPIIRLMPRGTWPEEMGYQISVQLYNRSFPDSAPTWTTMVSPTGTGDGTCYNTPLDLTTGSTLRQYNLNILDVRSNPFCSEFLRFDFQVRKQLENVLEGLKDNVKFIWEQKFYDDYTSLAENKVIADATLTTGTASFPLVEPTYPLTFGMLNWIRMSLNRAGAGPKASGRENGGPVYTLLSSAETIENILQNNPTIVNDLHFSSKANDLVAPLGVDRSYRGWYFINIDYPRRWNFVGGAWVRVWPFGNSDATYGTKSDLTSAYLNADYEDSIVFHEETMKALIPKPISSYGSGTKFDPLSYMGDFTWKNIPNEDTNPLGRIGRFYGSLGVGAEPVKPKFGYVIRHKRCGLNLGLVECPTYAYPA